MRTGPQPGIHIEHKACESCAELGEASASGPSVGRYFGLHVGLESANAQRYCAESEDALLSDSLGGGALRHAPPPTETTTADDGGDAPGSGHVEELQRA